MNGHIQDSAGTAKIIYILYLIGLVVPLTPLIGVIMAYVYRKEAAPWLVGHYTFQIRTFWIWILLGALSILLMLVFVGFLLIFFVYVWLILRCVKGWQSLENREPLPNPETWMFS